MGTDILKELKLQYPDSKIIINEVTTEENKYIFVKGRFIKYYKWDVRDGETYELYETNYVSFYNNKFFVCDTKSQLKKKLIIDIERKQEKDEYYKRY